MDIDFEHRTLTIDTGSAVFTGPVPESILRANTSIRRSVLNVEADELVLTLPGGIEATIELGARVDRGDALHGRRVVYLDQNHWSTMAAWRYGHNRVRPTESEAAERIHELVRDEEIVLLMSGGHAVETSPLYDLPRVALASTLMELSRGWHMRNPIDVRKEEVARALRGESPVAQQVASLGTDVLFTQRLRELDFSEFGDLLAASLPRVVNLMSVFEMLLDSEAIDNSEGTEAASRWAQMFADVGARLHAGAVPREMALRVAHGNVLMDIHPELLSLASTSELDAWFPRAYADISRMPYLSRYRAVIFARLRNTTAVWTGNDMTDLNFLCCAAGYVDVVAGERRTIGDLRTARDVPEGAVLATSLAEAVQHLESEPIAR